jgi:hypothetical protein
MKIIVTGQKKINQTDISEWEENYLGRDALRTEDTTIIIK